MEEQKVNQGALFTAYVRGYHSEHDVPKVFDDFLAHRILTEDEQAHIEQYYLQHMPAELFSDRALALTWLMQIQAGTPIALGRARYIICPGMWCLQPCVLWLNWLPQAVK